MPNNSETNSDLANLLDDIKKSLSSYIDKKLELYKLKTYEKVAVSGSFIGYSLIILLSIFVILSLCLFTFGLFLGEKLHSYSEGFGILILVSILLLTIFMLLGKKFRRLLVNIFASVIDKIESDDQ